MHWEVEIMTDIINYIVFEEDGTFKGLYNHLEIISNIIKADSSLKYCVISNEIRDAILGTEAFIINTELIKDETTIIDSLDFFSIAEASVNIDTIKQHLIKKIKERANLYITEGIAVNLLDGTSKHYSFKLEDQINLKELIDNNAPDDIIYYHADGELDTEYSYETLKLIYQNLYNNKMHNLIYMDELCKWILNEYTIDDYNNKEFVISYGYINDEILKEVENRYEQVMLL